MRPPLPLLSLCALLSAACAAATAAGTSTPAATGHAWVQYSARGVELRVVTAEVRCPHALLDGQQTPMDLRSEPGEGYPARTCALALPAATKQVEVVIHLGDYLYRESPCPAGNKGCEGSPWGDSLSVWQADFLTPADKLLASAPWLLLRGNHEECTRAGKGWSRLFDPDPFDAAKGCNPPAEPLWVRLGAVDLLDLDNPAAKAAGN